VIDYLIGKRTVKRVIKTVGAIVLLIGAGILFAAWHAFRARQADEAYHAHLARMLVVSSKSFAADGSIPVAFTCRGQGLSPQVGWEGAPRNVKSFVLLMVDWDTPAPWMSLNDFTHWALFNIPSSELAINEAVTKAELRLKTVDLARNSSDAEDYVPPCPPLGRHRYTIRVYALDVSQLQPRSNDRRGLLDAMQNHIVAFGQIVGVFGD
jgi:Raf kinase inhibitor-like YbhB/YbcL family protein